MTSDQLYDLAIQYSAMANSPALAGHSIEAIQLRAALRNEAAALDSAALIKTLEALTPHYEAMITVVRSLKAEIAKQARIEQIAAFTDQALAIAAAFRSGDIPKVISSLATATKLLTPSRA